MKKALLVAFVALMSFALPGFEWQTLTLMEKVTIKMPGKPVDDESKGFPMKKVVLEDGSEVNAFALDYTNFGLTEDSLKQIAGTDAFGKLLEEEITTTQQGVKVISNDPEKYNGKYASYDMVLDVAKEDYKGIVYQRIVFYKTFGVTLIYKPGRKDKEDKELKKEFFNSLTIEK